MIDNKVSQGNSEMTVAERNGIAVDIIDFTVEHAKGDVLGIGVSAPRLNWVLSRPAPENAQVLLQVTRKMPGGEPVHEETYLPASDTVLVPWQFAPLSSREEVEATVQVVSAAQKPLGKPSPTLRVEAGLLQEHEHVADFVGPSWAEPQSDHRRLPLVRTEVALNDAPIRARLYLSALGLVEAEINGNRVGQDVLTPGWTVYDSRVQCWTFDVTSLLEAGKNALGFWLGDGWYRGRLGFDGGRANYYGDRIGVFAQLEVEYADGTLGHWYSNAWDGEWKVSLGPIMRSDLYEGEHFDAREYPQGWSEPGFDDSGWEPVAEVFYDPAQIVNPENAPVRAQGVHAPRSIRKTGITKDGRPIWLVDFGQNCTQRIRLHIRGLQSGESVVLHHVEVLEPGGSIATRTLRRGQQRDMYTSNGEDAWWEPRFSMHGFRYVQIEGFPGELSADDIVCQVYHSELRRIGEFSTSNELLNQLHSNIRWSMRSNFVSLPTDCPQRDERMGWTGDICLFAPTATYLYDVQSFLNNWLVDVRQEQLKWGTVPFYVPFVPLGIWAHPQAIAIWGDSAVNVPWALYMESGDVNVLKSNYALAKAWVDEVSGYLSEDGVWDREPQYPLGQLGDWLDPTAPPDDPTQAMTEKALVATAFFARSCKQIAQMARLLNENADAQQFEALRDRVCRGFVERFTRMDGTMTSDTQCAYALTIAFGLLDDDAVRRVKAGNRLAQLVRESQGRVGTGFAGTPFVLPALSMSGHGDEAYELLLSTKCPSWLHQVEQGATTTWERWDSLRPDGTLNPGGMTSFNHYALGSVAAWMHAHIGGLEPLEAGWTRFRIAPSIGGGLTHAATSHLTPHGMASVEWAAEDGNVHMKVVVPVGCTAIVDMGDTEPRELASGMHQLDIALS